MLILKYFATVGTVLTAALLALSAYLAPSEPTAPARALRTTTASSLLIVTPKAPALGTSSLRLLPRKLLRHLQLSLLVIGTERGSVGSIRACGHLQARLQSNEPGRVRRVVPGDTDVRLTVEIGVRVEADQRIAPIADPTKLACSRPFPNSCTATK